MSEAPEHKHNQEQPMTETSPTGKKDQSVQREVNRDIEQERGEGRTDTQYKNPNRDPARGDWDRTGRHVDEGKTRSEE